MTTKNHFIEHHSLESTWITYAQLRLNKGNIKQDLQIQGCGQKRISQNKCEVSQTTRSAGLGISLFLRN